MNIQSLTMTKDKLFAKIFNKLFFMKPESTLKKYKRVYEYIANIC